MDDTVFVYNYNPTTKEYVGCETAQLDPLETENRQENVWLLPANSTFVPPLDCSDGFVSVWDTATSSWRIEEDHRGEIVWKTYSESVKITTIGPIPEGCNVSRPAPPEPAIEEVLFSYETAVQNHLDSIASSRGYDNTYTCLSYLQSTDETWNREAHAFNVWRDKVWRRCHGILNAVSSGAIPQPTIDELIEQLPEIDWDYTLD